MNAMSQVFFDIELTESQSPVSSIVEKTEQVVNDVVPCLPCEPRGSDSRQVTFAEQSEGETGICVTNSSHRNMANASARS